MLVSQADLLRVHGLNCALRCLLLARELLEREFVRLHRRGLDRCKAGSAAACKSSSLRPFAHTLRRLPLAFLLRGVSAGRTGVALRCITATQDAFPPPSRQFSRRSCAELIHRVASLEGCCSKREWLFKPHGRSL